MKERTLQFIDALRAAGVQPSVAESLDAMNAIACVGIERFQLRETLAAALVKDEADRITFDGVFDDFFRYRSGGIGHGQKPRTSEGEGGLGSGPEGSGPSRMPREQAEPQRTAATNREHRSQGAQPRGLDKEQPAAQHLAMAQALAQREFRDMDTKEQEDCAALAQAMSQRFRANFARRRRQHKHGRLDIRTTLRRSINKGGVPIDPAFRRRRPGRVDLVVLCDCSYSVAAASRFLLSVMNPCHRFFRRVHTFGFVDRPVGVSLEQGHLVPHAPLDLYARSDFGNTLVELAQHSSSIFSRNTLLLVLGDARNNRRPSRADVLAKIAAATREVVWLNPEPEALWDTGDSAMRSYSKHCGVVVNAANPAALLQALQRSLF